MSNNSAIETALRTAIEALRQDNPEAGMIALKTILDMAPRHEIANGMLASVYAQIGMRDAAVSHYHTTLDINPDNHLARFQLGAIHLEAGRPSEALQILEPLLTLEGQFLPQYYAAIALIALDRPQEAHHLLAQAQTTMPQENPLRPNLDELLDKTRSSHDQQT